METPNLSYIHSMARGDDSFVMKIIGVMKGEFTNEVDEYKNNIKLNNFKVASENVHKIKHKISILGLEKSYALANDYENELKEGKLDLHNDFDKILQIIDDYLLTI
ncbi:Hpt domain-containing protein [Seonamhaeicola sp. MEBiC1930]|uniref:Hpt domain-containing protein n=1 Tax=Seonamhaeicola sp. MEBiC01930 TaxID=2976768 RepID=UPI00324EFED5